MKTKIKMGPVILLLYLMNITSVNAQFIPDYLTSISYNVNVDYENSDNVSIKHNGVILDDFVTAVGSVSPVAIYNVRGAVVDGYHRDKQNNHYFSFDTDTKVNGTNVLKSDIILCPELTTCATFTYHFNAFNVGLKEVNINAFTFDPNNDELIFSIDSPAFIDGSPYTAADLIRYDETGNFSLVYDSVFGVNPIGVGKNINALTWLPNNKILVSFADDGSFSGIGNYFNSDVIEYNPVDDEWSLAYIPESISQVANPVRIQSLMAYENDLIFKNGFE